MKKNTHFRTPTVLLTNELDHIACDLIRRGYDIDIANLIEKSIVVEPFSQNPLELCLDDLDEPEVIDQEEVLDGGSI